MACRHHVVELVLASVFHDCVDLQEGQMLPCSSDSSKAGRMLTIQHYEIASDDLYDSRTAVLRVEMVNFFKEALEESQAREDYQEFISNFA